MGVYIRLTDYKNSGLKESEFFNNKNRYTSSTKDFSKIPGSPIAYWISDCILSIFDKSSEMSRFGTPRQGFATTDNEYFLKYWHEVSYDRFSDRVAQNDVIKSCYKWFPYNKGGASRKWYGNFDYICNWENNGKELKNHTKAVLRNLDYQFKKCITWSLTGSGAFAARARHEGSLFDTNGMSLFVINESDYSYLLALLCTNVSKILMQIFNPTLANQVGDIARLPVIETNNTLMINNYVENNINISKSDWDSRETSWDFTKNELIKRKSADGSIKSSLDEYTKYWTTQFFQLHKNEEELNKIFIEIYGLQDELTPDIPLSDITILKDEISERNEENKTIKFDELVLIKQFISYAVGCMVGRYSLDVEGLVYAGGKFDSSKYKTFNVDKDGIIPILPDDRFDDDITSRFKEFVKVVFGEKNYSSNIEYIATILGRKEDETAIECIRRYFLNDFYKDHVKMYKKKPIYWLYSSGKEKGFNAIVYMHRYKKETISILRMDYLHKLQRSYDTDYETAEKQEKSISDSKQKIQLQKKMIYLKAILQELKKYDELLRHYADKQVEIDLDDGVVVNYEKFKDLLVKI